MEYNYLSEDQKARETLYIVCELNHTLSEDDQKLFHDSKEDFDRLFS